MDGFNVQYSNKPVNRLDIGGNYDFNTGRHRLIVNGAFIDDAGSTSKFTDLPGDFQINASSGDTVTFGARELLRYVPNFEVLWGIEAFADADLTSGQTVYIELTDANRNNGYRYRFNDTDIELQQLSGGSPVDSETVSYRRAEDRGWRLTQPFVTRTLYNWYGAGQSRYRVSFPDGDTQPLDELGRTANTSGVATEEINLRPQVTVDLSGSASDLNVNIGSIGAAIIGDATQINRPKAPPFWGLGGAISQQFTDNDPVLAARINPNRDNVAVQALKSQFKPGGSGVTMELLVGAVHKDNSSLTVNFADPDDDGTDEGAQGAAQTQAQNDVMQYTRDVTGYPSVSGQVRADGTTGTAPDVRSVADAIASSGSGNDPAAQAAAAAGEEKRLVFPEDVVLFIPRTSPLGSTTSGSIDWLRPSFEQDF